MGRRHLRIWLITLALAAGGCGTVAPSVLPSVTPPPEATTFTEYATGFCSAFEAMFRAVGNPDTAEGSAFSKALDAAATAGDVATADKMATQILAELAAGRRHVAYARGWSPAAPMMAELHRVFLAFEAMVAAKREAAKGAPDALVPQAAFEGAGGVVAWFAMLEAGRAMATARPDGDHRCANVPIGP